MLREIIEEERVTSGQMGEDGASHHTGLSLQALTKCRHITRLEAQAVHAGIYFDMNRIGSDAPTLRLSNQRIQQTEAIHLRLQMVLEEHIETAKLRVHHDNGNGDALLTQVCPLISHRYR